MQPRAATGWLEWSKMDEENGKIRVALEILLLGLKVCPANEMLLTKVGTKCVFMRTIVDRPSLLSCITDC